jgi:hypothetical protein
LRLGVVTVVIRLSWEQIGNIAAPGAWDECRGGFGGAAFGVLEQRRVGVGGDRDLRVGEQAPNRFAVFGAAVGQ